MWQMFERQFQNEIYTFDTWFAQRWNRQELSFQNLLEFSWSPLISKSYDQFTLALWRFEVRLKFGKCDKCLNVNFRTKSKLSILDSHIVGTGKDQLSESARTLMIPFNLEELWSITMALWWFEVRLKFGKCDKCLNVNSRTKSILSIPDSHNVGTGKNSAFRIC